MQLTVDSNGFERRAPALRSAPVSVESDRAVAEIKGMLTVARMFPRDESEASNRIRKACERPKLALISQYCFKRGGQEIAGPTIRLAEELCRIWGNINASWKELERNETSSVCMAYAWDMESNFRKEIVFQVPHFRDTKGGKKPIKEDRDIYEHCANMATRRLRVCILAIIPSDIVEDALEVCNQTLKTSQVITKESIAKLIEVFAEYGVTEKQLEKYIGRNITSIVASQMVALRKIYVGLKDGMGTVADYFEIEPEKVVTTAKAIDDELPDFKPKAAEEKPEEEKGAAKIADTIIEQLGKITKEHGIDRYVEGQKIALEDLERESKPEYKRVTDAVTARKAELQGKAV